MRKKKLFLLFCLWGFVIVSTSVLGLAGLWNVLGINSHVHIFWGFEFIVMLGFGFLAFWLLLKDGT